MTSRLRAFHSPNSLISEARYLMVFRLVMPAAAFALLVLIGQTSGHLLGEYALVTTYYYVLQTLPLLGLTPLVMREVARRPELAGDYFATIGLLAVSVCVIINAFVMQVPAAFGYSAAVGEAIIVVGCSIFGGILAFLAETLLITLHQARRVALVSTLENIARLAISAVVLHRGGSVADLIWVVLALRLLVLAIHLPALAAASGRWYIALPRAALLRQTVPLIPSFLASTVLTLIISRCDFFVLSAFEPVVEIGYYAVAFRLFEISLLGGSAISMALFPRLARLNATAPQRFGATVMAMLRVALVPAIVLAILGCAAADAYVALLFSRQYPNPVWLARLFMLVFAAAAIDQLLATALNAANRQNLDLRALSAGGAVYVALLLILVPPLHLFGAWVALIAATAIQLAIRCLLLRREFGVNLPSRRELGVVALIIAAALTTAAAAPHAPFLNLMVGVLASLLAALFLFAAGIPRLGECLQYWHDAGRPSQYAENPDAGELMHLVACDIVRSHQCGGTRAGVAAVFLYRLSHHAWRNDRRLVARLFWQLNLLLNKLDVPPHIAAGPGLVVARPAGVILAGRIGANVTIGARVGIGFRGRQDVGAGPGIPLIGDGAVLEDDSGLLGGQYLPAGTRLPAGLNVFNRHTRELVPAPTGSSRHD
jgi:serine O-acetyltransferase